MFFYDSTYILVIIGLLLTMLVQFYMQSTFNKYQRVNSKIGITARDAAERILIGNGINDVRIGMVQGDLTDHYAPLKDELNLSQTTYNSTSIASIGVAAHEVGHAIQDHKGMVLLKLQMRLVPVVNFCSMLSMPIIIAGILFGIFGLARLGVYLFGATLAYQVITLPIEFNASSNAIKTLRELNLMDEEELDGVKKVLTAAALTYVAAVANTALQLLRLLIITKNNRRS
ncbi:MAG: zinc metallopeptidase [Lachnospiraceae bacterium]|nr:zinc metallopeptidase [Lachnospiraceae bacterium]